MAIALSLPQVMAEVNYCPQTGRFTHAHDKPGGVRTGDSAENRIPAGYRQIVIKRRRVLAHRLAWFITHGAWPTEYIDHIDGDRANNRISNLRQATNSQNTFAQKKTKRGDFRGIRPVGNRWRAQIGAGSRLRHIGYFDSAEAARAAYRNAAVSHYKEFAVTALGGGA